MRIQGIQKLTLLDYPGRTACTVFLSGCNFRCPFCHNAPLLTAADEDGMDEDELLAFLKKRQGLLDGVAVTGGEPLLRPDLPQLLEKIKALGYVIKLDTNGAFPERLEAVVCAGLADYVAMDVKNSPAGGKPDGLPCQREADRADRDARRDCAVRPVRRPRVRRAQL